MVAAEAITYIPRALESHVKLLSDNFKVVVVTGPRQVGKTTMLKHLMEEERQHGIERSYVTLDSLAMQELAKHDPQLFLQRFKPPVLIDEIQRAPELLPYIKILVDEHQEHGLFWLTGSQPLHLMKHVSESLAGRAGIVEMLGLSHAELTGVPSTPFEPSTAYFTSRAALAKPYTVTEVFENIAAGSLPAIRQLPPELRQSGYESYVDTYVMRDIRDLATVADELKFRRFMRACAVLTSRPVVYAELARIADIDEKTAKNWLSLLVSSYLVKIVEPYSNNLLKRLSKQPIMHFLDTGLAAYLAGWDNPMALESSAMGGQLFETHAYGEVLKSYLNAGKRCPLFFFRTNDKKEIDMILEKNNELFPIEVKKSAAPSRSDIKNFGALDPVASAEITESLQMFKRTIGLGTVLCLAPETYPLSQSSWVFPLWGI